MAGRVLVVFGSLLLGSALGAAHAFAPRFLGLAPQASGALVGAVGGLLLGISATWVWGRIERALETPEVAARCHSALLCGAAGAIIGLVLRAAIVEMFPSTLAARLVGGVVAGVSVLAAFSMGLRTTAPWAQPPAPSDDAATGPRGAPKLLDTSVIIDGRIGDLVSTGFIEGEILVPEFVLHELQGIADSSDALRRKKGRRGLEILRHLMEDPRATFRVITRDYPSIAEVDRKLMRLAHDEAAVLITTDYNLNRVAQVEGIAILNVNELANAVKPRFVPGEQLDVEIIDRGAEINQGVGYLDDGTMIVVENGRRHVGRTIRATVKSTLQTDAGRMLFAEPAGEPARWEKERELR